MLYMGKVHFGSWDMCELKFAQLYRGGPSSVSSAEPAWSALTPLAPSDKRLPLPAHPLYPFPWRL